MGELKFTRVPDGALMRACAYNARSRRIPPMVTKIVPSEGFDWLTWSFYALAVLYAAVWSIL